MLSPNLTTSYILFIIVSRGYCDIDIMWLRMLILRTSFRHHHAVTAVSPHRWTHQVARFAPFVTTCTVCTYVLFNFDAVAEGDLPLGIFISTVAAWRGIGGAYQRAYHDMLKIQHALAPLRNIVPQQQSGKGFCGGKAARKNHKNMTKLFRSWFGLAVRLIGKRQGVVATVPTAHEMENCFWWVYSAE